MKKRLICICGPTASGKTALSIALAKKLNTEIISADSMQLYRGMDIGTAKPDSKERAGIAHHLLDVCEPDACFSVALYVKLADAAAQSILSQGKTPIVVGGTGLYMDALIDGSAFSGNEKDTAIRDKYSALAKEKGNAYLYACLAAVDAEGAKSLHPNNVKRVIRALEVYEQTGMTLAELNQKNKRSDPKYQAIKIGVCPTDRGILYERINYRVDQMLKNGLLEETKTLYDAGKLTGTAAQAIAYKELLPYFRGEESLENCSETLKQNSRNYAKRQLTWLKRDDKIHWIYYNREEELAAILQEATRILTQNGVQ